MNDLEIAKEILKQEKLSVVLVKGDTIYKSEKNGVAPLIGFIEEGTDLNGFCAADKIVGKASAMLMIYAGVKSVFSPVMSRSATETLQKYGVDFSFDSMVEMIINRQGDGMCPMEATVLELDEPTECFKALCAKLAELRANA